MNCIDFNEKDTKKQLAGLELKIKKLSADTTARLLMQDGKIAETCLYIKNNLSTYLSDMFSAMEYTKEVDRIIIETVSNELNVLLRAKKVSDNTDYTDVIAFDNVVSKVVRDDDIGVSYIVTRIKNILKPHINFTNGTNANPYENHRNVIDYMKTTNKIVAINAGLRGVTVKDGVSHIETNLDTNEGFYILCITPDGRFKALPRSATGSEIIAQGYRDAMNIWSPIIEDGLFFDESVLDSTHEDYDYIFNQRHPRQIVGVMPDGDYVVITIDGRMVGEKGANFAELKRIVQAVGCVSAYNLDGGASTQTVIRHHLLNRKLSDSRTIGTVITFESEVSNNAKCVS